MVQQHPSFADTVAALAALPSKTACLTAAYQFITSRHYGNRYRTFTRFWEVWPSEVERLWQRGGFLHCTNMNRLLIRLLRQSGHFAAADIHMCWTLFLYCSPHQYLRIRLEDRTINVDPWAAAYGLRLGEYAHGWHIGTVPRISACA